MQDDLYLPINPLSEHNGNIALSSKAIPTVGTGSLYQGQGGRAFVQGGGGSYYGFNVGENGSSFANGSYAPIILGKNEDSSSTFSVKSAGGRMRRKSRSSSRSRSKYSRKYNKKRNTRKLRSLRKRVLSKYLRKYKLNQSRKMQRGGSPQSQANGDMIVGWGAPNGSSVQDEPNAAYSIGGTVQPNNTALANPAQAIPYNSAHPVL